MLALKGKQDTQKNTCKKDILQQRCKPQADSVTKITRGSTQIFPKDPLDVVSYLSLYIKITSKNYFQGAPSSTRF